MNTALEYLNSIPPTQTVLTLHLDQADVDALLYVRAYMRSEAQQYDHDRFAQFKLLLDRIAECCGV